VEISLEEPDAGNTIVTLSQTGIPEEDRFGNHDVKMQARGAGGWPRAAARLLPPPGERCCCGSPCLARAWSPGPRSPRRRRRRRCRRAPNPALAACLTAAACPQPRDLPRPGREWLGPADLHTYPSDLWLWGVTWVALCRMRPLGAAFLCLSSRLVSSPLVVWEARVTSKAEMASQQPLFGLDKAACYRPPPSQSLAGSGAGARISLPLRLLLLWCWRWTLVLLRCCGGALPPPLFL
jgi:hypothetical protein